MSSEVVTCPNKKRNLFLAFSIIIGFGVLSILWMKYPQYFLTSNQISLLLPYVVGVIIGVLITVLSAIGFYDYHKDCDVWRLVQGVVAGLIVVAIIVAGILYSAYVIPRWSGLL